MTQPIDSSLLPIAPRLAGAVTRGYSPPPGWQPPPGTTYNPQNNTVMLGDGNWFIVGPDGSIRDPKTGGPVWQASGTNSPFGMLGGGADRPFGNMSPEEAKNLPTVQGTNDPFKNIWGIDNPFSTEDPYKNAPPAQDFNNPNNYGWGNFSPGAQDQAGFYADLAKYHAMQSPVEMQRTGIDWSGMGSGQGPAPSTGGGGGYPSAPGYPSMPGSMGFTGDSLTRGQNATTTYPQPSVVGTPPPPAPAPGGGPMGSRSVGMIGPQSLAGAVPAIGAGTGPGSMSGGGPIYGSGGGKGGSAYSGPADFGQPPPPPPTGGPAVGGVAFGQRGSAQGGAQMGVQGMSASGAPGTAAGYVPPQPRAPGAPPIAQGSQAFNRDAAQNIAQGRPSMTPANQTPGGNPGLVGVPPGQETIGPGGIPMRGQFANPVFQQQQQTRNVQGNLMNRFSSPSMFNTPEYGTAEQSRGQQMSLVNRLQNDLAGNQPSLAEMQLRRGSDAAVSNAQALAASAGPGGAGFAQRNAMRQAALTGQRLASDTAMLRAQEYAQARGELGGATQALRGQDLQNLGMSYQNIQNQSQLQAQQARDMRAADLQATGMSYENALRQADLERQQNATQANLGMQQRMLNLQGEQGFYGMGMDVQGQDLGSRMHYLDLMAQKYANDRGLAQNASQFNQQRNDKLLGTGLMVGGSLLGSMFGPGGAMVGGYAGQKLGGG